MLRKFHRSTMLKLKCLQAFLLFFRLVRSGHELLQGSSRNQSTISFESSNLHYSASSISPTLQNTTSCRNEWKAFWESRSSYSESIYSIAKSDPKGFVPSSFTGTYPNCPNVNDSALNSICGTCTVYGGDVLLNYWPVGTLPSESNITIGPKGRELVTQVVNGLTFTSPTVYLSFYDPSAQDNCGILPISNRNTALSMSPNAVSTLAGNDKDGAIWDTINYADLNFPTTLSSSIVPCEQLEVFQMQTCTHSDPKYLPFLAVPDQILRFDPSWNNCIVARLASFDPPRRLVPAQALIGSTTVAEIDMASATPMPAPFIRPHRAASSATEPDLVPTPSRTPKNPAGSNLRSMKPTNSLSVVDAQTKYSRGNKSASRQLRNSTPSVPQPSQNPSSNPCPKINPATESPVKNCPTQDPVIKDPSVKEPSLKNISAKDPPVKSPSADLSSTKNFSTINLSIKGPSATDSSAKDSPAKSTSAENFLTTDPSTKNPSTKDFLNKYPPGKSFSAQIISVTILPTKSPFLKGLPSITLLTEDLVASDSSTSKSGEENRSLKSYAPSAPVEDSRPKTLTPRISPSKIISTTGSPSKDRLIKDPPAENQVARTDPSPFTSQHVTKSQTSRPRSSTGAVLEPFVSAQILQISPTASSSISNSLIEKPREHTLSADRHDIPDSQAIIPEPSSQNSKTALLESGVISSTTVPTTNRPFLPAYASKPSTVNSNRNHTDDLAFDPGTSPTASKTRRFVTSPATMRVSESIAGPRNSTSTIDLGSGVDIRSSGSSASAAYTDKVFTGSAARNRGNYRWLALGTFALCVRPGFSFG